MSLPQLIHFSFIHVLCHHLLANCLLYSWPHINSSQVCNHPDLFEPRPITSPFVDPGVTYAPGSLVTTAVMLMLMLMLMYLMLKQ